MLCEKKLDRVEIVRDLLDKFTTGNSWMKRETLVHLSGVSNFASLLAIRRGQVPEIAAISGLLHSFYFIKTGITTFPGPNSADAVRPILRGTQLFSNEELTVILRSIFYQEDRLLVHGPYEEILKDAIVLQLYFQKTDSNISKMDLFRLKKVFVELGISVEHVEAEPYIIDTETEFKNADDKRLMLADFAENLAGQNITGVPEDELYREICRYWPDSDDIHKVLERKWCAAFVYYCCMQVGIELPIRYPNADYRLAGVGAWLQWAQLPETGFFYYDGQDEFTPQRGDLVIYEKLLSDDSHDHIGVVLACANDKILVAEGNKDNQNYSCVLHRKRGHCILGYVRIENSYHFQFSGEYQPIR